MTDQMKSNGKPAGVPRHMGATREVPLVGYRPRHDAENKPRSGGPHLAADGSKVHVWPVQDPNPTARFVVPPSPRPHIPHPAFVAEPAMSQSDASTLRNMCLYAAGVAALVAVVVFVATVVIP